MSTGKTAEKAKGTPGRFKEKNRKKIKDKIREKINNNGSALVTVIIAMAFVGILASLMMYTAMLNYHMKANNLRAKDTFYSAESVLDEIRMGIERDVSLAIQDAYQLVLTNFESTSSDEKWFRMRYQFLSRLQAKCNTYPGEAVPLDKDYYDLRNLYDYLANTQEGTVLETTYKGVTYTLTKNAAGDYVDAGGSPLTEAPKGAMVLYEDGISLKDVKVTYTSGSGFVSIIETDLRVRIPNMEFAQAISLPALTSYSLVAREQIVAEPLAGTVSTNTIRGCFYAERLRVGSVYDPLAPGSPLAAVNLKLEESATDYNSDKRMVVAEELYIGRGSNLSTDQYGELWARTISMHGGSNGGTSELIFGGNDVYVADDLEIDGERNILRAGILLPDNTYQGKYIGFGAGDAADESSSIIINGTDTELYLDKLTNLTLAGNTYVGLSSVDAGLQGSEGVVNDENVPDIAMGQSIAVKSDQVAYLVPGECIGINTSTGTPVQDHLTNPMTIEEYQTYIQNKENVREVSADIASSALGGKKLSDYGIVTDGAKPMYQKYFKRVNSKITLVYFYVTFDSGDAESMNMANQYFADYYHANKATLDAYTQLYTKNIQMRNSGSDFYTLHLAGNVERHDSRGELALDGSTARSDAYNTGYKGQLGISESKFKALCKKLMDVYDQLTIPEREDGANVYTNLVHQGNIGVYSAKVQADTGIADKGAMRYFGSGSEKAVVVDGDYTYTGMGNDDFHGLIIATGDVVVKREFHGTILSGGTITLDTNVLVEPDRDAVLRALTYKNTAAGLEFHVTDFLIGGEGYLSGSGKAYADTDINLGELIVYENWQKQ